MNKCLLFDCDGTLVDSERLGNVGLVIKFKELGVELDADVLVTQFRGWQLAKILEKLCAEHGVVLPDDFVDTYRKIVAELFETQLVPIAGILSTLEKLPYPKAVVSNGPVHKIKQALRVCNLSQYFGANIYSAYEVGIWKPDPGLYQYAATDMGFAAHECIVIDDGPVGVEAGIKAGMKTLFYNRFDEPCYSPSVLSFDSMSQLPDIISSQ